MYSANRRSTNPFASVLFTSVNGRTFDRLEKQNDGAYKRWANTEWWQEGYERLWTRTSASTTGEGIENAEEPKASLESVVYLTADSDEELLELKEDETYIIGGIVDHNRYTVGLASHAEDVSCSLLCYARRDCAWEKPQSRKYAPLAFP